MRAKKQKEVIRRNNGLTIRLYPLVKNYGSKYPKLIEFLWPRACLRVCSDPLPKKKLICAITTTKLTKLNCIRTSFVFTSVSMFFFCPSEIHPARHGTAFRMHVEVSVALNFVISYLYNKLPRRRVNIFGEELEKCLTEKFAGHWYPEKPYRGSAYRCIKTGSPIDPVFERASRESGVAIQDVLENLPQDLAVWVDPGEVSYRVGEKGAVKILYNETNGCVGIGGMQQQQHYDAHDDRTADREVRVRM